MKIACPDLDRWIGQLSRNGGPDLHLEEAACRSDSRLGQEESILEATDGDRLYCRPSHPQDAILPGIVGKPPTIGPVAQRN